MVIGCLGVEHRVDFGLWTLECLLRGNVGIHRDPKDIQVDGSRPRRVSLLGFPCSSLSGTLASYGASAVARTCVFVWRKHNGGAVFCTEPFFAQVVVGTFHLLESTGGKNVFSLSRLFFLICSERIPAFF
jgi:hypothetical protein